jgi:DNA-binding transcriptional regulator YhcF (GntR family)
LALALGASQRTVQRALAELEAAGRVRATARAGFTTILLLPTALSLD